jgi:hypothetical protein
VETLTGKTKPLLHLLLISSLAFTSLFLLALFCLSFPNVLVSPLKANCSIGDCCAENGTSCYICSDLRRCDWCQTTTTCINDNSTCDQLAQDCCYTSLDCPSCQQDSSSCEWCLTDSKCQTRVSGLSPLLLNLYFSLYLSLSLPFFSLLPSPVTPHFLPSSFTTDFLLFFNQGTNCFEKSDTSCCATFSDCSGCVNLESNCQWCDYHQLCVPGEIQCSGQPMVSVPYVCEHLEIGKLFSSHSPPSLTFMSSPRSSPRFSPLSPSSASYFRATVECQVYSNCTECTNDLDCVWVAEGTYNGTVILEPTCYAGNMFGTKHATYTNFAITASTYYWGTCSGMPSSFSPSPFPCSFSSTFLTPFQCRESGCQSQS